MNKSLRVFAFMFFAVAVGCVVIPNTFEANINITIRHIEEQANEFWDEVEGTEVPGESKANELWDQVDPNAEKTGSIKTVSYLRQVINFVSPIQTAYAQESKDTSPRLEQIKDKIKQRYPEVVEIKKAGAVGESNRGMLDLAKPEKITDTQQKNEVQRILAAENEDRKALYKEIARLNKEQNMTVGTIENIHSATLRSRANPGDLIQLPNEGEEFEKFKATALGKKVAAAAQPGAWVTVP